MLIDNDISLETFMYKSPESFSPEKRVFFFFFVVVVVVLFSNFRQFSGVLSLKPCIEKRSRPCSRQKSAKGLSN